MLIHSKNRVVERQNRHLLKTTWALLIQEKVPRQFFADAVSTTCFLIDRIPSNVLVGGVSYDVLFPKNQYF